MSKIVKSFQEYLVSSLDNMKMSEAAALVESVEYTETRTPIGWMILTKNGDMMESSFYRVDNRHYPEHKKVIVTEEEMRLNHLNHLWPDKVPFSFHQIYVD